MSVGILDDSSVIEFNEKTKELLALAEQHPNSQTSTFYIGTDKDNNPVVRELTTRRKLDLMDEIAGDNIWLREGETRERKILRLTVAFSDLLDAALEQNLSIRFAQIRQEDLAKMERGTNSVCLMNEGEIFVWSHPEVPNAVAASKSGGKKKKKEKIKKFAEFQLEKPVQMSLFELLKTEKDFSHTVELYDFVPKFVWGKSERIQGKFLEPVERSFICGNRNYNVVLMPARVQTKKGEYKDYFPGKREELVEDALRKIMSEHQGLFLDDVVGTTFTLYQLQTELKNRGHSYSYDQLKEALDILAKTDIELKSDDEESKIIFRPIETLGLSGKDGETQTFVRFSPLVTQSIKKGTYRLINYDKVMSYKSVIARQLHKRMSHFYTQASLTLPYHIMLSTIIRDFGLTRYAQLRNNMNDVEKAIEEMKELSVIINYKSDKVFDTQPKLKLKDVKFTFQPHPFFVDEAKKANAKSRDIQKAIEDSSSDCE